MVQNTMVLTTDMSIIPIGSAGTGAVGRAVYTGLICSRELELAQGALLHGQIGFDVRVRGGRTFVPKPQGNHTDIDAGYFDRLISRPHPMCRATGYGERLERSEDLQAAIERSLTVAAQGETPRSPQRDLPCLAPKRTCSRLLLQLTLCLGQP
jgi:hypothetical protein